MARLRKTPPFVLAIGGHDPSCGAGIVADARSIAAMGAMPLTVATAITVQSGSGLRSFRAVATELVIEQFDELARNLPIAAIKLGQIPNLELAQALAAALSKFQVPIVFDPVLKASGGGELVAGADAVDIVKRLLPMVSVLTPNLEEASLLSGRKVHSRSSMEKAAQDLADLGAEAVLVKGGHLKGDPVDLLFDGDGFRELPNTRIAGSMHGTGCALASALAARLALGDKLERAVEEARAHVRELLSSAVGDQARRLRSQ